MMQSRPRTFVVYILRESYLCASSLLTEISMLPSLHRNTTLFYDLYIPYYIPWIAPHNLDSMNVIYSALLR